MKREEKIKIENRSFLRIEHPPVTTRTATTHHLSRTSINQRSLHINKHAQSAHQQISATYTSTAQRNLHITHEHLARTTTTCHGPRLPLTDHEHFSRNTTTHHRSLPLSTITTTHYLSQHLHQAWTPIPSTHITTCQARKPPPRVESSAKILQNVCKCTSTALR